MKCTWITDKDNPSHCNQDASVWNNFAVCEEHLESLRYKLESMKRGTAVQTGKFHGVNKFPGLCYTALLPSGKIKIGYVNDNQRLKARVTDLSREHGGAVVLLKVIDGGFVAEASLHTRFQEDRMPGPGELFSYSPRIAQFIEDDSDLGNL